MPPRPQGLTILHTESSNGWGGQEIRILTEADGMQRRGHRVLVAATPGSRLLQEAGAKGVPAVRVGMDGWRTLTAIWRLRDVIRRERVDIVNTHSSRDSWLASMATRLASPKPILIRTRHLSTPIERSIVTRFLYNTLPDAVITTGESIRVTMIERHRFDARKIISIPTGVDTAMFSRGSTKGALREAYGIPRNAPLVGIVAVLRSWKGHEDFLDAARLVLKDVPGARFVIVGDGPRAPNIRDYIERLGLAAAVTMTGHRSDVASVLADLDVFVLSSFGHEGVPQAVLQAMAMEVPVVATNVGSVSEVVRDGETGLLAPPLNPEALAAGIVSVLQRADLGRELASAGRRLIEDRYRLDAMLDRLDALYDDLVRGRGVAESTMREARGW
jgi:glycosyltransferase involved in cell wall biosynthesis